MTLTKVKGYFFATRPWSFSCCAQPAFLGNLLAYYLLPDSAGFTFNWLTLVLTLVGMVVAQAGCNMVNDYFDYRLGCDLADNTGAHNSFLTGGPHPPRLVPAHRGPGGRRRGHRRLLPGGGGRLGALGDRGRRAPSCSSSTPPRRSA